MDKTSTRKFIKRTEQQKLELIDQWEKSGLPIKTFCDQHQFSDSIFHAWLNKYRRSKKQADKPGFTALQLDTPEVPSPSHPVSLFAELITAKGDQIKLYRPVSVDFLYKLLHSSPHAFCK